jgi:hypothetical protein
LDCDPAPRAGKPDFPAPEKRHGALDFPELPTIWNPRLGSKVDVGLRAKNQRFQCFSRSFEG